MEFIGKSKKDALVAVCRGLGPDAEIESISSICLDGVNSYRVTAFPHQETQETKSKSPFPLSIIFSLLIVSLIIVGFFVWPMISQQLFPITKPAGTYAPAIAVMPFKNIGEEGDHPHFGEGLAEDIISGLINLQGLKIISRSSAFAADASKETNVSMGASLGVATILRGTYRINKNKVKIVASLIDTSDGSYIWTTSYDHEIDDLFQIQEDISREIIEAMKLELGLEQQRKYKGLSTTNNLAWRSFHAGWFYLDKRNKSSFEKAVSSFEAAIEADPAFARAYYGLAFAWYLKGSYNYSESLAALRKGLEKVEAAIKLNPGLGEAYAIRGLIRRDLNLDWAGAEADFKKALELSPGSARTHHWYGNFLGDLGRFQEAENQLLKAQELEPISRQINLDIAVAMIDRMDYREALAQLKMTTEMFPDFRGAHHLYLITLFRRGYLDETLEEFKRFNRVTGQSEATATLEELFYEKGFYVASRAFLKKYGDMVGPHEKAALYMVLGDGEKAIDYLEEAFKIRSGRVFHLRSEPVFIPLHDHPRFRKLLQKMNLE